VRKTLKNRLNNPLGPVLGTFCNFLRFWGKKADFWQFWLIFLLYKASDKRVGAGGGSIFFGRNPSIPPLILTRFELWLYPQCPPIYLERPHWFLFPLSISMAVIFMCISGHSSLGYWLRMVKARHRRNDLRSISDSHWMERGEGEGQGMDLPRSELFFTFLKGQGTKQSGY
jgi:hypothetical protein